VILHKTVDPKVEKLYLKETNKRIGSKFIRIKQTHHKNRRIEYKNRRIEEYKNRIEE
jgi:hypothetical protein